MKHLRKCTALLLAVLMVLALAACGQKDDTAAVDKDLTVNVVSLNGTTGFGSPPPTCFSNHATSCHAPNFQPELCQTPASSKPSLCCMPTLLGFGMVTQL